MAMTSFSAQSNIEALAFDPERGTVGARRKVTNTSETPSSSNDGNRLMFYSDRSGRYQVWTIAADGGGLTQVTDFPGLVIEPVRSCSPS